ncbi:MAG: hypothetical protein HYX69_20545 [Planctomycetia bacterium]|nr:hypothetical protein [Planctomycetia bacterium]
MAVFRGRISRGDTLIFEGNVWVEEAPKGRPPSWRAGFLSPTVSQAIDGDIRLDLADGRTGTMQCSKAQPAMSTGTNMQFQGVGPLAVPAPDTA